MPGRASSIPSPHLRTNSVNASLGNAKCRQSFARDTGQAHADGRQARSPTLAKRPMPANHGVAATPDHPSFPSARAGRPVLCYSRRCVEALNSLSRGSCQAAKRRARGFTRISTIRTVIFLIAAKLDFRVVNPRVRQPA